MKNTRNLPILMTALIILCPLRCISTGCCGEFGSPASPMAKCSAGCSACESEQQPAGPQPDSVPESPEENCPCQNCVCNGALTTDAFSLADSLFENVFCCVVLTATVEISPQPQVSHSAFLFPVNSSADARAALGCWLI